METFSLPPSREIIGCYGGLGLVAGLGVKAGQVPGGLLWYIATCSYLQTPVHESLSPSTSLPGPFESELMKPGVRRKSPQSCHPRACVAPLHGP